jgi:hypothetical protein
LQGENRLSEACERQSNRAAPPALGARLHTADVVMHPG